MIRFARNPIGTGGPLTAMAVLSLFLAGCTKTQSTNEAVDAQLKALNTQRETLAKFAGRVTVDGQAPEIKRGQVLLVMLYDQKNPDKNKPPTYASCKKDGSFEFYRYVKGDGVPLGSYVVLFAELNSSRAKGLVQPDGLKNLYDDPDKNAKNSNFVVEITPPGKTDYDFNLEVGGKDPGTPGAHAVTEIRKN